MFLLFLIYFFNFIFFIFLLAFALIILLIFSTLELNVSNFDLDTRRIKKVNSNYIFTISLKLFGLICFFKFKVDSKKIRKIKDRKSFDRLKLKIIENTIKNKRKMININYLKVIKMLEIKLKKLKLDLSFDTEDVCFTSYLVAFISAIIGILIGSIGEKYDNEKYSYLVTPYFLNSKFLSINLNCIFNVKLVHIITVIILIIKKRSEEKYERASNRRTYDYSNE